MTQQYLAGELSQLLAQLPLVTADLACAQAAVQLRLQAETLPIAALGGVLLRSLELVDDLCWGSLERGDIAAFSNQADVGAQLHEFGVCARLLAGTRPSSSM